MSKAFNRIGREIEIASSRRIGSKGQSRLRMAIQNAKASTCPRTASKPRSSGLTKDTSGTRRRSTKAMPLTVAVLVECATTTRRGRSQNQAHLFTWWRLLASSEPLRSCSSASALQDPAQQIKDADEFELEIDRPRLTTSLGRRRAHLYTSFQDSARCRKRSRAGIEQRAPRCSLFDTKGAPEAQAAEVQAFSTNLKRTTTSNRCSHNALTCLSSRLVVW